MNKGTGGVVGPFFVISGFDLDARRFYLPHQGGFTDDGDYSTRTVFTSYKKGNEDGLGTSLARVEVEPRKSGQAQHRSNSALPPPQAVTNSF